MTAQALIDRFSGAVQADIERDRTELASQEYDGQSQYDIVRINSFEEAEEYGDYVSWCVTYDEDMYNSYTSDGINVFYFCLRKGFEDEEKAEGDNCPLDSYGLSMIAVSVLPDGALNTCTCRWNHENGGTDGIMDTGQISQVIGMNFYNVFKGNEEYVGLAKKCKELGIDMRNLTFNDGYAKVKSGQKWNFINKQGNVLSPDLWFNEIHDFYGDFAIVRLNKKWNFINKQGNILSPRLWFEYVGNFREDFASVRLNRKWNFIDGQGDYLSPKQWFDWVDTFREGYAEVRLHGKYNFIDKEGNYLSPNKWFDYVYGFCDGYRAVNLNGKKYLLNGKGQLCDYNTGQPISTNESKHNDKMIRLTENKIRNLIYKVVSRLLIG